MAQWINQRLSILRSLVHICWQRQYSGLSLQAPWDHAEKYACYYNETLLYQGYKNNTLQRKSEIRDCQNYPFFLNNDSYISACYESTVVPLGKALYPHCFVPRKGLKAIGPLHGCLLIRSLLSFWPSEIQLSSYDIGHLCSHV